MHYTIIFPNNSDIFSALGPAIGNGYYGVTAFFTVSGFLITDNIFRRYGELRLVNIQDFYVMRIARIFPPLILLIAVITVMAETGNALFKFSDGRPILEPILYAVTFRFNVYYLDFDGYTVTPWAVLWSLSIEEAFYLVYPIILLVLRKTGIIITALLAILIGGIVYRTMADDPSSLYSYIGCSDAIAVGALAAIVARRAGTIVWTAWLPIAIAGLTLMVAAYGFVGVQDHYVAGPLAISMGAALFLFASAARGGGRQWSVADPLAFVGDASYEIYLFHCTVFSILAPLTSSTAVAFVAVIAASAAVRFLYAEPSRRLIRRLLGPGGAATNSASFIPSISAGAAPRALSSLVPFWPWPKRQRRGP